MANVSFTLPPPPSRVTNTDHSDILAEEVDGAERQCSSVLATPGFTGRIPPGVSILSVLESEEVGKRAGQGSSSKASLELISNYWNGIKRSKAERLPEKNESTVRRLSTEEIMRMAGMRFIQSQDKRNDYISAITQCFGSDLSGLSEEDLEEVDLTQLLLAAAEKVGENELDRASRLLSYCEVLSSKGRSTAQSTAKKVVLLFVDALRERINIARGEHDSKRLVLRNNQYLRTSALQITCYRVLPFIQIAQFSAIQVLVENTATASRVHIVDLAVRSGVHVIILMQALLDRKEKPIELLKVSAVATTEMDTVEESGKRLVNVAKSMGLNFLFRVIPVQHIDDVREEMFDIEDGEAVAVYSPLVFKALISRQKNLENLMTVLRSLNSSVMVMTEIQANHNSPSFVERFIEGLFFYSAFMDCVDTCLATNGENNVVSEKCLFSGVKNMLSTEGEERTIRNVKIDVWRAFFTRQGMVEVGMSESSLYHGRLVAQQFPNASFSTLEHDGKCLIVGWRGTPFLSVSAWKFR